MQLPIVKKGSEDSCYTVKETVLLHEMASVSEAHPSSPSCPETSAGPGGWGRAVRLWDEGSNLSCACKTEITSTASNYMITGEIDTKEKWIDSCHCRHLVKIFIFVGIFVVTIQDLLWALFSDCAQKENPSCCSVTQANSLSFFWTDCLLSPSVSDHYFASPPPRLEITTAGTKNSSSKLSHGFWPVPNYLWRNAS